jgi:hypothetical protein
MPVKSWPIFGLLVLGLSACAASPVLADDKEATWIADFDKAKAAARAAGKPIFLVFR